VNGATEGARGSRLSLAQRDTVGKPLHLPSPRDL